MGAMRSSVALVAVVALVTGAGCATDEQLIAPTCIESRETIEAALAAAPEPVRLTDGTRLSACVEQARSDADLQTFGIMLTGIADELQLRAREDPRAAARLGYLIGAARKGAERTNGVALELSRRLERTATLEGAPAAVRGALQRGLHAGEATG